MGRRPPSTAYVALLRGINVGGKNPVSMKALKAAFEGLGLTDVTTYINSGNVLFRASATDARRLERRIDRMLSRAFGPIKTVVRSHAEMAELLNTISTTWTREPRWRYNVIFLRRVVEPADVLAGVELKADIERVVACPGTLLWSARLNALTRSAMLKLSRRPIYQEMTVRSVTTTTKIFELMQRMEQSAASRSTA